MSRTSPGLITQQLRACSGGDSSALEALVELVYHELRRLANHYLRLERSNHTLQPTALVHEVYLRLAGQNQVRWQSRSQFFGLAAQMMRRILVDHARTHSRAKRGGPGQKLSFEEAQALCPEPDAQIVALDEALSRLKKLDPRKSDVVELRYFGGLSVEETAEVLGVSVNTVMRDWTMAKAWLYQELKGGD